MSRWNLSAGRLEDDGCLVLKDPDTLWSARPLEYGAVLRVRAVRPESSWQARLGEPAEFARFLALGRTEPFWMIPFAGDDPAAIPVETQLLWILRNDGKHVLLAPLIDAQARAALRAGLTVDIETGDSETRVEEMDAVYVVMADSLAEVATIAAAEVGALLGIPRRGDIPVPPFAETLGWCTWDAFYHEVSHEKVRQSLASFRAGGIQPRFVILDDGWQQIGDFGEEGKRLTGFGTDDKFPNGLGETVRMAKDEYGVETFLVWHTIVGYWGGVDPATMGDFRPQLAARHYAPSLKIRNPDLDTWFGGKVGRVPPKEIGWFFEDYHKRLQAQGVDGVKVDSQAVLESLGEGVGGRIALMRAYAQALETTVQERFEGNLINCMSCSMDRLYQTRLSTLTRTSDDFWPNRPESHGRHLWTNAAVGTWFGEFVHPDWDMFQSAHPMGAFHAAARAISGSPVYVSDKPDAHDFEVLRRLAVPGGSVPRCPGPARLSPQHFYEDPTASPVPLMIYNQNRNGGHVLGLWHAQHGSEEPIRAVVRCSSIPTLEKYKYVFYRWSTGEMRTLWIDESWTIEIAPRSFEIFWVFPAREHGLILGRPDYYNGAAFGGEQAEMFTPRPGPNVAYIPWRPSALTVSIVDVPTTVAFEWDESGMTRFTVPPAAGITAGFRR